VIVSHKQLIGENSFIAILHAWTRNAEAATAKKTCIWQSELKTYHLKLQNLKITSAA
jgi:hypothetical protein